MEVNGDFIANSQGRCFLCKRKTIANFPAVKVEPGHLITSSSPTYSLRCLSRYLNLDFNRNALDGSSESPSLLNCKIGLKAELCDGCATLNDKFSKAYRHLEKSEMEVAYYHDLIQMKLGNSNVDCNRLGSRNMEEITMKIVQKHDHKLKAAMPRIQLKKLRHGNAEYTGTKLKSTNIGTEKSFNTFSMDCIVDPDIEIGDVKVLRLSEDPTAHSKISKMKKRNKPSPCRRNLKNHQCNRCLKLFTSDYYLKDHYNSAHLHQRRICKICGKEFKYRQSFNFHNRKFHGRYQPSRGRIPNADAILVNRPGPGLETRGGKPKPTKMIVVDKKTKEGITSKLVSVKCQPGLLGRQKAAGKYVTGATIIEPVNSTTQKGPEWILNPVTHRYKCVECPREYKDERSCQDHYNTVHRKVRCCCNICSKILCTRQSFRVHYRKVHQGITFRCPGCLKTFTEMHSLLIHQRKRCCGTKSADKGDKSRKGKRMEYEHDELSHEQSDPDNECSSDNVSSLEEDEVVDASAE